MKKQVKKLVETIHTYIHMYIIYTFFFNNFDLICIYALYTCTHDQFLSNEKDDIKVISVSLLFISAFHEFRVNVLCT